MMSASRSALVCVAHAALAAIAVVPACVLHAQSSLGQQGLGYPPGQVSTRAIALGASMAELDPVSPRNPASIARWGRSGLYLQYDPEFRRVSVAGDRDGTLTARFPLIGGATRTGRQLSVGFAISTLLDRTYTTESEETIVVEGEDLVSNTTYMSTGGVNDVRLGVAYDVSPELSVGLAGHVITGENRVRISTIFDREGFVPLQRQAETNYTGTAFSGGVNWLPGGNFAVAGSMRLEGTLRANRGSDAIDDGNLPARAGLSVAYTGISGAVITAGGNWEQWSRADIGSSSVRTQDTREYGIGIEAAGPRARGAPIALRGGVRMRDLPFGSVAQADTALSVFARERAFALGAGVPLATYGGVSRAMLDIGLQRASRTGQPGVTERAWTISLGLAVRP